METLVVANNSDVINLFSKAVTDCTYFENKEISFSSEFSKLIIHLKGDKFHSTITTGVMKGLIALQETIYTNYSIYAYGERKKLSQEEKKALELIVKIDEGSSILEIDWAQLVKDIGIRIKKMTGKEILATIGILATAVTLNVAITKSIDAKSEIEKLKIQGDTISIVQRNTNDGIKAALEAQASFFRSISRQDFENVSISGESFTPAEVAEIVKTTRERRPVEQVLYTGEFVITDIHFEDDSVFIDVCSVGSGKIIKYVNIFREFIGVDDYQWLKDSANRQPIKLAIVATEKNGEIIASSLQMFEK